MKRLMLKIVFSGFVIAWRFATWPTSRSPLFVNATTDGVMRAALRVGDDLRLAALHGGHDGVRRAEVDADDLAHRSSVLLRVVRHSDEARPDDPVVQAVAALHLADHGVVGMVGGVLVGDRLVKVRIEWLADGLDGRHALRLEDVSQLALDELHALDPRVLRVGGDALEGSIEVVEDGEQLADQQRVAELAERARALRRCDA